MKQFAFTFNVSGITLPASGGTRADVLVAHTVPLSTAAPHEIVRQFTDALTCALQAAKSELYDRVNCTVVIEQIHGALPATEAELMGAQIAIVHAASKLNGADNAK